MTGAWEDWVQSTLSRLDENHLFRQPRVTPQEGGPVLFSTNDYLGLSRHPEVTAAAMDCFQEMGTGTRASALIAGRTGHHDALEVELAQAKEAAACLLFPSGYAANVGLLSALASDDLEIFSDAGNHASIIDGCRLARVRGATITVYRHLDLDHLNEHLQDSTAERRLIVTDSLFSMTGEIADLAGLVALAERHDAVVAVDEAHASLVFGAHGGGIAEREGLASRVLFQTGTLSKAFGLLGGFVATSADMKALLFNRARSQVFSTALPAPIVAAARVALKLGAEGSGPRRQLKRNLELFAQESGLDVASPIIAINLGRPAQATEASARLADMGIAVPAIRPPTVPENESRLRISLSAAHSEDQVQTLCRALADCGLLES